MVILIDTNFDGEDRRWHENAVVCTLVSECRRTTSKDECDVDICGADCGTKDSTDVESPRITDFAEGQFHHYVH